MFNKDVTHANMRREIDNPRVVLLDCPLEYKKGESMTAMEFTKAEDFKKAIEMEEIEVKRKIINKNGNRSAKKKIKKSLEKILDEASRENVLASRP